MPMTTVQRTLAVAGGIVLAFLLGFGWQAMRASRIGDDLERTQRELAFTSLEATLGAAAIEADRGSYEASRQLASDFFTGLQGRIAEVPTDARPTMTEILAERDATITMLSRADPESRHHLGRMFLRYRLALGRETRPPPTPAPVPTSPATDSPATDTGRAATPP